MFGTQSSTDFGTPYFKLSTSESASSSTTTTKTKRKTTIVSKANNSLTVKFEDIYGFVVEGNIDDVNILNDVSEKVRKQGKVWWELEASRGANWYLQSQYSSNLVGITVASLRPSVLSNTITLKKLIRKGIPPNLRPKVWLAVSGAAKKRSTVPESYYDDLIRATEGKVTRATRQIDNVSLILRCVL